MMLDNNLIIRSELEPDFMMFAEVLWVTDTIEIIT